MYLHCIPYRSYQIGGEGSKFTYKFCSSFKERLSTKVKLNTAFHRQTYGQAERTIQTLEDMLRACIIDFKGSLDKHFPLVDFS